MATNNAPSAGKHIDSGEVVIPAVTWSGPPEGARVGWEPDRDEEGR
jgi:hypothetical protein